MFSRSLKQFAFEETHLRNFPLAEALTVSKHKAKDEKPREEKLKDKRKSSAPTIFENVVEQATERWEQLVHNPQFAAALATALEQPMNLAHRVQELVSASLHTMNIPTRDDYKQLSRQLDAIAGQLEDIGERLEALTAQLSVTADSAKPPRKSASSRKKKAPSVPGDNLTSE